MNETKPNRKTGEQIKAVLMTYYTRPLMWFYFAFYILLSYFSLTGEVSNDVAQDLSRELLFHIVLLNTTFTIIVLQLLGHFSHWHSKLVPGYFRPHLIVACMVLFFSLLLMAFGSYFHGIPIRMWIGPIFGFVALYSLIAIWTIGKTAAIWCFPFAVAVLAIFSIYYLKNEYPFVKISYYWYLNSYQILFPIPVAFGLLTLWAYSEMLKDLFNTRSDRGYQNALLVLDDLDDGRTSNFPEMEKRQDEFLSQLSIKSWNLSCNDDRLALWKAGIVQDEMGVSYCFKWAVLTAGLHLIGFFESTVWHLSEIYLKGSMLIFIFMAVPVFVNWKIQLKRMGADLLKPIPKNIIIYDVFRIHFLDSMLKFILILCSSIYIFYLMFFSHEASSLSSVLLFVFVFNTITLFICSVLLYIQPFQKIQFGTRPDEIIKRVTSSGCFIFFIFIMVDLFKSFETESSTKIISYAVFFFAAAMFVFYLTYHKWQNMEWGAKG